MDIMFLEGMTIKQAFEARERQFQAVNMAGIVLKLLYDFCNDNSKPPKIVDDGLCFDFDEEKQSEIINGKNTKKNIDISLLLIQSKNDNVKFRTTKKEYKDNLKIYIVIECLDENFEFIPHAIQKITKQDDSLFHECEHVLQIIENKQQNTFFTNPDNPTEEEIIKYANDKNEIYAFIRQFLKLIDDNIIKNLTNGKMHLLDFRTEEKVKDLLVNYGFYLSQEEYKKLEKENKITIYQYLFSKLTPKNKKFILNQLIGQIFHFYRTKSKSKEYIQKQREICLEYGLKNMAEYLNNVAKIKKENTEINTIRTICVLDHRGFPCAFEGKKQLTEEEIKIEDYHFKNQLCNFFRLSYSDGVKILKKQKPELFKDVSDFGVYLNYYIENKKDQLPFD